MVLLTVSDLSWKLLPHPFTNFFLLSGIFFSECNSMIPRLALFQAVSNFILVGFFLYVTAQIIPHGLGGGDIKMGAGLTIWLGLSKSLMALFLAFGLGCLAIIPMVWLKKIDKKTMIPFGPFLAFGSVALWFCPNVFNQMGLVP
jgi:prepilin signal peptidase PulO-like enzyme (type II secretory pathway)